MTTLLESLEFFASQLGLGLLPLFPKADTLGDHVPDLSGLSRDMQGIICQLQADGTLDGGDSVHRTGVASFCNSAQDIALLPSFESNGIMVRHPTQVPWNNWRNCTRDQLMGYVAGCWRGGALGIVQRLLAAHAARIPPFTCQDTENDYPGTTKIPPIGDPLGPDHVMYLRIGSGDSLAYTDLIGQFALQAGIELADPSLDSDKNNLLYECILCGRLNYFVQVHQNYEACIRYYWSRWRGQPRIAEELLWVVNEELRRYPPGPALPLFPVNVLNFLRGLDLKAALTNIDPQHHALLAARFLDASLKDAANTLSVVMGVGINAAVSELHKLGATANQIAKAFAEINQPPNAIRQGLQASGVPDNVIAAAVQAAFPGIPHADAATPHQDVAAIPHTDIAPVHQDVAAVHTHATTEHTDVTPHTDHSFAGAHGDVSGPHADAGGIHADAIVTPAVDVIVTPHVDVGPTAHIDVPPTHIDTP